MAYNAPFSGSINQITRDINSATINNTIISGDGSFPFAVGALQEIVFNNLCTSVLDGTPAPGWTGTSTPAGSSDLAPFLTVDTGPYQANNTFLQFTSPANINVGTYVILYKILLGTSMPLIDLTAVINGGSPINLRTQFDSYIDFSGATYISMMDFFSCTENNATLDLIWTVNGKNASSGGYTIIIGDCLRIIKIG